MSSVIIVTGASRGIGAATARLAAQRGYAVCVNYVSDRGAAEAVVDGITAAGGRAIAVHADVSAESDVVHLFETVDEAFGPVTALVNNAGTLETQMRLDEMDAARIQRILAINAGTHANPCFAGDTLYAWSEVLETAPLRGRGDAGLLRLRTLALKDRPASSFPGGDPRPGPDGKRDPAVLLDLDYWVALPA